MIIVKGLVCLIGLILCPFSAGAEGLVKLRLKEEVRVFSRTYTLGDIAELYSNEGPDLAAIAVGVTPRPGQLARVTCFEVTARLEQEVPGLAKRLRWEGPNSVQVRGLGVRLDAEILEQSAQTALLEWLQSRYRQVTVLRLGKPKSIVVPAGEVSFQPKLATTASLKKRISVWVDVLVDGQHFQTIPIWFGVSIPAVALVASRELGSGQILSAELVAEKMVDIAGLGSSPLSVADLPGKRMLKKLDVGEVVTVDDVELIPAVSRGELVTVFSRYGFVSVAVKGIALSDGRVSELIQIKNSDSGESYLATVIGESQAEVK